MINRLSFDHDHEQYLALLRQLTDTPSVSKSEFNNRLREIYTNPHHNIFIMQTSDKIFATITVLIEPKIIRGLSYVAHIEDVVILDEFRGKGHGKVLVDYAIQYSKDQGCYKVILDCSDHMKAFYQKMGFKDKGLQMAIYF